MEPTRRGGRMRKWVVMSALATEVARTCDTLGLTRIGDWGDIPLYRGKTKSGDTVIVFTTGVGKVRASAATQYAIDRFKPTHILFVGAAGALSTSLSPGQVVIAHKVIEYDFDDRALARNPDKPPRSWDTDQVLGCELASAAGRVLDAKSYRYGTVLTGDKVICDPDERDHLRRLFGGDCIEMEGAAVAATGSHCGIPVGVLRVVSDFADEASSGSFSDMLGRVGSVVARIVEEVVSTAVTKAASASEGVTARSPAVAGRIPSRR